MNASPFRIARWALSAAFALMVLIVSLPNPAPSTAWKIAETKRHRERFPQLRIREDLAQPATEEQLARGVPADPAAKEAKAKPYRTAHLPDRPESGSRRPASSRRSQQAIEQPAATNLAPDPVHLDPPN